MPRPEQPGRRRIHTASGGLAIVLATVLLIAGCGKKSPTTKALPGQIITVFAPVEMEPIIRAAENVARDRDLNWVIDLQTGGPQSLAWTIESGDIPDLYIASNIQMARDLIPRPTTVDPWLHDQLVVATLRSNPDEAAHQPRTLERTSGRVAVGGDGTQLGEFARLAMRYAEIWPLVERRTTQRTDAEHAIAALKAGEVEAAVVFASDAARELEELDIPQVLELPESLRIIYTKASFSDLGAQFADLLNEATPMDQARASGYLSHDEATNRAD